MSYIQPNSSVIVLKGIPFENNYEHTILFDNEQDQHDYFYSKRHLAAGNSTLLSGNYSYQRVGSNKIRIGAAIEQLINCNYMMFKNISFENKWFYAFVTDIEYVNNNCTELTYELDVMQSWMFDYTLQECFVEREHSTTDNPGDNTVPESLEVGDYVYEHLGNSFDAPHDGYSVIIAAPFAIELDRTLDPIKIVITWDAEIGYYNGLFTALHFNTYNIMDANERADLNYIFEHMLESDKEQIVAIFMVPTALTSFKRYQPIFGVTGITKTFPKAYSWNYGSPVRNNKLYTYPFNMLYVANSDGNEGEYKYELFNTSQCEFVVDGVMGLPPEALCTPQSYAMGNAGDNYVHSMPLKNFPLSSWYTDGFKAWLAQTSSALIGSALAVGAGWALGGPGGAILSSIGSKSFAFNTFTSIKEMPKALLAPQHAKGTTKNIMMMALGAFGYRFYNAHIKPEYAAIIDDYFNKYGYATKRVKVPNIHSRPFWNYVETKDCNINQVTGLNSEDTAKISSIYDHGITFWHTSNVGDYTQNNAPVGGT